MNRTGKPNRLNRTGTELEPNPKGHEIYHFDQNFKPAFTPLNLVQSSPFDLQNDPPDRAHLLKAACVFDENGGFPPEIGRHQIDPPPKPWHIYYKPFHQASIHRSSHITFDYFYTEPQFCDGWGAVGPI